eukprot:m.119784 g.119784  ORF g.119784 m.119784 type:complete len:97 (-) comp12913_c0_seq3:1914-2204(-)
MTTSNIASNVCLFTIFLLLHFSILSLIRLSNTHTCTLSASRLEISSEAQKALRGLNGEQFIQLNKTTLRNKYNLKETDVAKLSALLYDLSDPRATQ